MFSKSILFSSNKVGAGASQVCELWENPEGVGGDRGGLEVWFTGLM